MTVGEKIKKYRNLKGLTQKQLGGATEKLKGKTNAGVRINQYENTMIPSEDMRKSIADALDTDIQMFNDIDITSDEEIMCIFFELEETKGLCVKKDEHGQIYLTFDKRTNNRQLCKYLSYWAENRKEFESLLQTKLNEMNKLYPNEDIMTSQSDVVLKYENWKARFFTNANKDLKKKD